MVHLDNLKELAKKFRLHKSIPNFFRDYTTEDSLVAVLKRYVRNNAAFLSAAPSSVATARRSGGGQQHAENTAASAAGAGAGGNAGIPSDASQAIGKTSSIDSASHLDGGASLGSSGMMHGMSDDAISIQPSKTALLGDPEHHNTQHRTVAGGFVGILSTDAPHPGGAGGAGGSMSQNSRAVGMNTTAACGCGSRVSEISAPRRPSEPKRPTKVRKTPRSSG